MHSVRSGPVQLVHSLSHSSHYWLVLFPKYGAGHVLLHDVEELAGGCLKLLALHTIQLSLSFPAKHSSHSAAQSIHCNGLSLSMCAWSSQTHSPATTLAFTSTQDVHSLSFGPVQVAHSVWHGSHRLLAVSPYSIGSHTFLQVSDVPVGLCLKNPAFQLVQLVLSAPWQIEHSGGQVSQTRGSGFWE